MGIREDTLGRCGAELKAWRETQTPKLTQTMAAEALGASQGSWAAWERGHKAPDAYFAGKLEALTGGTVKASSWAYPRMQHQKAQEAREARAPESGTDVAATARAS